MLLLAKLAALGVIIWFYMTANKTGEPPVKWAIIGLVGYLITWLLLDKTVAGPLSAMVAQNGLADFLIDQIPTLGGLAAAHFIRKKLLSNVNTAK
ncbi:hypothetical protein [Methyloglobulus sp.]|uniref:hypothetical protein n=1 Tax=Methyloglobulus sp. TaxID=2518622 RepID=UPI003989CC13